MLQRGCGCVWEEDRPLISSFLSLGKGGSKMLSLLPNECTGDHRDKRLQARPVEHISAHGMVHCMHLKLFALKCLPFFPTCVILSLLSFSFSYCAYQLSQPGPLLSNNKPHFHSWRALHSPESLAHTHWYTHRQNHCLGIGDSPTIQPPLFLQQA